MRESDRVLLTAIVGLTPNGQGWVRLNCVLCPDKAGKDDKKRSLGVNVVTGRYHCFRCGGGRIRAKLEGFENLQREDGGCRVERVEVVPPPEDFMLLTEEPAVSALAADPARFYLRRRAFSEDLWVEAQIGVCLQGKFAGRIIVPIIVGARWRGWVGRVWVPKHDRPYIYPEGMPRGEYLYNQDALAEKTDVPILVVEGVMDALAYWPHAVAVLGKPSGHHVEILATTKRPIVVVLDGDAWAEGEALALHLQLEGCRAGSVKLPPLTDPDEVPKDWLWDQAQRSLAA